MSYHVIAYGASVGGVTNSDMTPVTDPWLAIQNGHYLPHMDLMLFGGAFFGAAMTAIRLVTPRSRMVVPSPLYPLVGALLPPDRPHVFDRRRNPFKLNAVEEVSLQANVGGTVGVQNYAVLFVGDRIDPVPQGDVYALHGTSTTAAVTGAWTQITVTWDQTIPAGTYAVISSQHQSTNGIAHRFYFKDQVMRPGFLSLVSLSNISEPSYYYGGWGVLGRFVTYAYPTVEVLCNGTDNAHDIVMNIIKTG